MWYHLKDNFSLMLMVPVTQKRKFFTKLISGYQNLPLTHKHLQNFNISENMSNKLEFLTMKMCK